MARSGFVWARGGSAGGEPDEGESPRKWGDSGRGRSGARVSERVAGNPEPLARTMYQAIEDGGLAPADVNVVYASANATGVLDATEARAISCVFGDAPVVTSIKGALGESGASGIAACAAALLCGAEREVPPIAGLSEPCAEVAVLNLARQRTTAAGPVVLINVAHARASRVLRAGAQGDPRQLSCIFKSPHEAQ